MGTRVALAAVALLGTACITAGVALARADAPRADAPAFGTGAPGVVVTTTVAAAALIEPVAVATTTAPVEPVAPVAPVADTSPTPPPPPPRVAPPVHVALVAPDARAQVVPVGVNPGGDLQLPVDPGVVGWWAAGAVPGGAAGNVVLAAHIDSAERGVGVFAALLTAEPDDAVEIASSDGEVHRYRVVARDSYPKSALPAELFDAAAPPGLVLVTCGGEFDRSTGHYEDNIVVYAEPA